MVKNKGLITKSYEWDEEEVLSDDNVMVKVKVLMVLAKENDVVSKEGAKNGECHPLATIYDSSNESLVCSTPLSLLKKLDGAESTSRTKTIKSILRLKSTFKAKALKGVIINEPSLAPAKGNKSSSASKVHSAPV
nr:hypothetical protein [Tanacetum cinerariifolium]